LSAWQRTLILLDYGAFHPTFKETLIMPHSVVRWRELAAVALLAFLPAVLTGAPAAEDKARAYSPAEKVRKALDQKIDFEIAGQSIVATIDQFKDKTKLNVVLDTNFLAQNGIDVNNHQISIKVEGVKARSALRSILGQHHLGYAVLGDTVIVTTEDMAMHRQFKQKVSLDLDKVELEKALKDLSKETAVQVCVDKKIAKEAATQVSLQLDDVPLDTAVRLLCEQAGVKPVRMGNVLYITSPANAKELRTEPDLAPPGGPGGGQIGFPPVALEATLPAGGAVPIPRP
jgi:type II secretory pathway component GspD/PulD (secretin)